MLGRDVEAKAGHRMRRRAAAVRVRPATSSARSAGSRFRRFGFVQSSIVSRWSEIVGERYAKVSSPESIRFPAGRKGGGALTLLVEGAHAPLIQHLAPMIIERVNRFFGYEAINRVVFSRASPRPRSPRPSARDLRPVPKELGEGIREIADPELRACLELLAAQIAASNGPPSIRHCDDAPLPEIIRSK